MPESKPKEKKTTGERSNIDVSLTPGDAELIRSMLENYDFFKTLIDAEVQHIHNGKATLNFDHNGNLGSINVEFWAYKR